MRSLGPDEAELWARVTVTIRPLSREVRKPKAEPEAVEAMPTAPPPPKLPPVRRREIVQPAPPRVGSNLDGSWDKRLRSGSVEPDRIVDLHGHNLDGAWSAIDLALDRAIVGGDRVILLITGHERPGEPPVQRGKIRGAVHDWLNASRHASKIAAVRGAHRRHGGGGSLYVILRRN